MAKSNLEWSSEEMIKNASSWSLAGDIAIMNSLKKFSETLLTNTESLNGKVDNLLNNLESVSLKLELTKNEFQSLRNTQFIENRVYEDDETLDNEENKVEEKELTDEDKENALKRSISKGLKVMEKYYDKVELAVSDSEGEGNENSYVLQPKDLYADRPLPYVVGTQEWYKKWHVGLLLSDSESESEKEAEVYSSGSDSEEYLPKNRILGSETSSELDFTNKNVGPAANSTFNDSEDRRREVFHSSDESSEQSNSLPVKTPISNKNFAEQLAAKLGDITNKTITPDTLVKPTNKPIQPTKFGTLFSNEPPPLDDSDDTVLPKSATEGLFSGGRDLFGENTNDGLFWDEEPPPAVPNVNSGISSNKTKKKVTRNLFDETDSSSEEDMLTVTDKRKVIGATLGRTNPYMQPYKSAVPFVDEQPPEITFRRDSGTVKKKPVGGISILGENTDIFAENTERRNTIKSSIASQPNTSIDKGFTESANKPLKKTSLFDESSDEEMFVSKPKTTESKASVNSVKSKLKQLSLFGDSDEDAPKQADNSGISTLSEPKKEDKLPPKKISLFDDDDDFFKEEEDIFSSMPKKKNLFGDSEQKPPKKLSLFEDVEEGNSGKATESAKSLFGDLILKKELNGTEIKQKKMSLFDDLESPDDDLFSIPNKQDVLSKEEKNIKKDNFEELDHQETVKSSDVNKKNEEQTYAEASTNQPPVIARESEEAIINKEAALAKPDLKQDKKDSLEKIRKSMGLFDSESDNSDEDVEEKMKNSINSDARKNEETKEKSISQVEVKNESKVSEEVNQLQDVAEKSNNEAEQEFSSVPPPINLFDPTPPPVDWDATSDHSGESDTFSLTDGILDRTSYNQSQPTPSSIFDEAPPILDVHDMNYSSGIGRDINATRVETDDSSFYPHASSSRRLSSDIFSDQQSQDSFFVTKNTTESSTAQVAGLAKITENPSESMSKIEDLTPSGNIEDFEGSNSVFEGKEESESDDEMDKTTSMVEHPKPVLPLKPSFSRAKLATRAEEKDEDESSATKTRQDKTNATLDNPKPQTRSKVSAFRDQLEQLNKEPSSVTSPTKSSSPGKLKLNLNINVGALLPGARPVMRTSQSLDETDDKSVEDLDPRSVIPLARPRSELNVSKKVLKEEKQDGFGNVDGIGVLQSVTKDRVRGPIKRRPSTRRARQEAVQKSASDFSLYTGNESNLDDIIDKSLQNDTSDLQNKLENVGLDKHNKSVKVLVEKSLITSDTPKSNQVLKTQILDPIKNDQEDRNGKMKAEIDQHPGLINKKDISDTIKSNQEVKNEAQKAESDPQKYLKIIEQNFPSSIEEHKDDLFRPSVSSKISLFGDVGEPDEDLFTSIETNKKTDYIAGLDEQDTMSPSKFDSSSLFGNNNDIFKSSVKQKDDKPVEEKSSKDANKSQVNLEQSIDLFKSAPLKKIDIFVDRDSNHESDDDLFSSASKQSKKDVMKAPANVSKNNSRLFAEKSDSDSDTDLFGSKSKQILVAKEEMKPTAVKNDQEVIDKKQKSENDQQNILEHNKPPIAEKSVSKNTSSLFSEKSDSDSDSELFGSKSKPAASQSDKQKIVPKKTSIFDNSDSDDEDLFGSKSTSERGNESSRQVRGPVPITKRTDIKAANVRKLENKEVTDFDPLYRFK